jgi:hypothetical protein
MRELMKDLPSIQKGVYEQVLTDPTIRMQEKATIWAKTDKYAEQLRLRTYDRIAPMLQQQFARHELSRKYEFSEVFPEPPGLALYRRQIAAEEVARQKELEEQRRRDEIDRQQ